MALNRAVEINHGRGLPGTPLSATGSAQPQRLRASPPRQIKITEQADQSCQDSSRIHAIKGVEQFAYLSAARGTLGHDDDLANQLPRINLANGGSMQSAQVVTLNIWTTDASSVNSTSPWLSSPGNGIETFMSWVITSFVPQA
jgi:hypothetical protein